MEKQHGVYCTQDEWLGVLAGLAKGMALLQKEAEAGDMEAMRMFAWANRGASPFQARIMEELGMQDTYDAWLKGDHEKAKKLANDFNKNRAGQR